MFDFQQYSFHTREACFWFFVLQVLTLFVLQDDAEGHALLHALQQRAESWAGANVCTTIFSSDDYAPYRHLKKSASRMNVISVKDLTPSETHVCLAASRAAKYPGLPPLDPDISLKVWDLVGGRLSILSKLVHKDDLIAEAERLIELEKVRRR